MLKLPSLLLFVFIYFSNYFHHRCYCECYCHSFLFARTFKIQLIHIHFFLQKLAGAFLEPPSAYIKLQILALVSQCLAFS